MTQVIACQANYLILDYCLFAI